MLAMVPPMFYLADLTGSEMFANSYNIILFMLLSGTGILIPYMMERMNKHLKIISLFMSGWFLSMLIYEFSTLSTPEIKLQSPSELYFWFKYATCFVLGTGALIVNSIITKWK